MKKKKEKKPRKKNFISELETVTYEQQIVDNNRQLARLRTRNEELEAEAEKLREQLQELEENKADLTSHLQRYLDKKSEEAQELQERLVALEKLRKFEQDDFKKREEQMEREFRAMENNLTAEIKLAAGKLNALEDFRLARVDLMKKFEEQEKQMAEQEVRHKETLYETEKKFIIGKAKMQSELEQRLTQLAESFRDATNLRLADATQRTVRENIALNRELKALLAHCRELDALVEDYKERERNYRLNASLYEAEARITLEKMTKQNEKIERLVTEQQLMSQAIARAMRAEAYAARGDEALEEARRSCAQAQRQSRLLEQNIELSRDGADDSAREAVDYCREIQRLRKILTAAKQAIREALMVQSDITTESGDEEEEACSSCIMGVKEKLLHSLLDILASYQESTGDNDQSTVESEPIENLYEFGHLGLIPAHPNASTLSGNKTDASNDGKSEKTMSERTLSMSECSCE